MARASASYNLNTRNGTFYVRFKDPHGKFASGINTLQKNKNDALAVVALSQYGQAASSIKTAIEDQESANLAINTYIKILN